MTRKRKNEESKENEKRPRIDEKWIPEVAREFWTKIEKNSSIENELKLLKNAELVGPFRVLKQESEAQGLEVVLLDRSLIDLPEMQTFLKFDKGKYCFWRDEPDQKNVLVVFVKPDECFPEIKIIGNRVEHAIHHLFGGKKGEINKFIEFDDNWEKEMKDVEKNRKKNKLGNAPHEVGIWVKLNGNVGYRSLVQSSRAMKSTLKMLKIEKNEKKIEKGLELLDEEFRHVQIANDECDFGMGLEFGHWLFLANIATEKIEILTRFSLKLAYTFLGRLEFYEILDRTLKIRNEKK